MKIRATLIAVLSATTIAACGDDEETPAEPSGGGSTTTQSEPSGGGSGSSGGGSASTLKLTAGEPGPEQFSFDPKSLDAKAGEVTIDLALPDDLKAPHAIALEGGGVSESGETVSAGDTSTLTADLKPGKYTFFCPVGDHREEGMEGTLTVG